MSISDPEHVGESVYIYCAPAGPPEDAGYQHEAVALAEGLSALGIPVFANVDYWRRDPGGETTLLRRDADVSPVDCTVVVVAASSTLSDLPTARADVVTVFLDAADGLATPGLDAPFRDFDLILRAHFNAGFVYPAGTKPWAFGLTTRILTALGDPATEVARRQTITADFRVEHPVRTRALPILERLGLELDETKDDMTLPPSGSYDKLMWTQTGRRHHPAYYARLRESLACAAFGGMLLYRWPKDQLRRPRFVHKVLNRLDPRPRRLFNWDSWRFWEGLAAGCAVLHVDLERHGARLPVMPEPWRHYIPIDLDDPEPVIERLHDEPEIVSTVATEGRKWALAHYAPEPTARRLLDWVGAVRGSARDNEEPCGS